MSLPTDDHVHDAAAYVIGALTPAEVEAFEAHLPTCHECRAEFDLLAPMNDALALAVPQRSPGAELRARVLGPATDVNRQGARVTPLAGATWSWMPVAASVALAAAVGLYAARLQTQVSDLEGRLAQAVSQAAASEVLVAEVRRTAAEAQSSMAVLAAPDVARIDLAGQAASPDARARALWSRNSGMIFTAFNLPALPPGRVYQVWVVTATAPVSAGLLMLDRNGNASVYFPTPVDIPPPTAVAVTAEPAGGVPAPTGAMYLVGMPSPL